MLEHRRGEVKVKGFPFSSVVDPRKSDGLIEANLTKPSGLRPAFERCQSVPVVVLFGGNLGLYAPGPIYRSALHFHNNTLPSRRNCTTSSSGHSAPSFDS